MKNIQTNIRAIFGLAICSWVISPGLSAGASEQAGRPPHTLQSESIVFAVIGDFGSGEQPEADVANLVKSWNPDFVVTVGDNNYPNGSADTIDENIGQYYHEYIYPYKGSYGAGSPYKRFFPALGNHDWMTGEADPYFDYFSFYSKNRYYEFVNGPVHFFILDSDPKEPDGISSTSKQAKWLKNGLANSTSMFNVVVTHHPPYSSGKHGPSSYMQWPFKSWGADAVLSGHDHLYERIMMDGLTYFVNGVGGEDIYGFGTTTPGSQVRFNQDFGAMRVEANGLYMKFQFFTRSGALVDEYRLSNTFPIVSSIVRTTPTESNAASLDFAVTFSEPVTGVDISDFRLTTSNVNGAAVNSVSGSGNTYILSTSSGSGDGTLRLDLIDDDSISNGYGNKLGDAGAGNGNFVTGETYTIDKTPPGLISLTRSGPNPSNAASVEFVANFSEAVTGVDTSDFAVTSTTFSGDSIASISGTGSSYLVSVSSGVGDHILGINFFDDDSISDAAGNKPGGLGSGNGSLNGAESYLMDKTAPVVTSIIRASTDFSNAGSVDFIVTFSESVRGVDIADFGLNAQNVRDASINSVYNADPFYVISVNTGLGSGTLQLELTDDASISDMAGNLLGSGGFAGGEIYTIDKGAPRVISIARADSAQTNETEVDFVVDFSEPVTGVDAADFTLVTNMAAASIGSLSGSGRLYTVTVNTGQGEGQLRLDLIDDDSIANIFGTTLGSTGRANGDFASGEIYEMDRTHPVVTSIIRASADPSGASNVDYIVTFSESVSGVDVTDFGPISASISGATINNVQNFDPFYIVSMNTGMGSGSLRLDLADNDSILDLAGNPLGGLGSGNGNFGLGENYSMAKASVNFPAPVTINLRRNLPTNDSTPTFYWTVVRGAMAYEVFFATDSDFTQIAANHVIDNLSYTVDQPLLDGVYFWRVRAYNKDRQPGRFSFTQSITIDTTPPLSPVLLGPGDRSLVSRKPVFTWTPVSTALTYQIEVDDDSDFTTPEFTTSKNDTSIKSPSLPKGGYFWRVRAKDLAGNWSDWSAVFTFTVP